jgi:predicted DNA-binding protein (UPF0251 family)
MVRVTKTEIEAIRLIAEKEFPDDPALQQVHISRKILAREAELNGLSVVEYVRSISRSDEAEGHGG